MIRARRARSLGAFAVCCWLCASALVPACRRGAPPPPPPLKPPVPAAQQAADRLRRDIPAASVGWDAATGYAREAGNLMGPPAADPANPEVSARAFLSAYADLFGIADEARTLRAAAVTETRNGADRAGVTSRIVRFGQVLGELPVYEGEVVVRLTASSRVLAVYNSYRSGLVA